MGRGPQKPPDWHQEFQRAPATLLAALAGPTGEAIRRLGDNRHRYLHWHEFRRREFPSNLTPKQAWVILKMQRAALARHLPLLAADGTPVHVVVSDPLRAALRRIDVHQALKDAGLPAGTGPESETFTRRAIIEEALASSRLEGARTTRAVGRELLRSGRPPRNRSERMILNNYRALQHLEDWIDRPLTPELLCEIQAVVTEGTLDDPAKDWGRIRRDNDVRVWDPSRGEVVHQPPDHRELPERVDRLCAFANAPDEDEAFLHPVVRAALLHHQLAHDHPFGDGNGRTARWLFLWFLVRRSEYRWFRFMRISRQIEERRPGYYLAFQQVATDGFDATYFVRHQVRCIELELRSLARFLNRRRDQHETIRRRLRIEDRLNVRQVALFDHLSRHPDAVYTQRDHARYHGVTQVTAGRDLNHLAQLGLLERERLAEGFVYRPTPRFRRLAGGSAPPSRRRRR